MQPEIIVAHERFRLDLNHSFQKRASRISADNKCQFGQIKFK